MARYHGNYVISRWWQVLFGALVLDGMLLLNSNCRGRNDRDYYID